MSRNPRYFTLTIESLRALGAWAADCAERALPVFEKHSPLDARPREAIEGIRAFAGSGNRTAQLRTLSLAAFAAARDVRDPAAVAAARAAGLAASSAYTHPLVDVQQTKHVVGPAAYGALAIELDKGGDPRVGDRELRRAIKRAPAAVREILAHMPARSPGKTRIDALMHTADAELCGQVKRPDAG